MDKSIHKVDAFRTDYLRNPDPSCTDPKLIWDFYKGGYDGKQESRRPVSVVKKRYAPIATSFSSSDDNFKCRVKKSKKKRTNLDHGVELASTIDCFNHSMDDISNGSSNVSHNYDGRSSDDTPSSSTNGIFDREAGRKQRKKQRRNKSVKRRLMRENIQAVADATYAALASTINNRSSSNNNYNKNNTSEGKKHDRGRINLSRMLSPDQCNDRDPKETRMTNTKSSSSTRTSKQGHGQGPYPPISVWSYGCSILSQQDTEFGLNCDEDKLISDYTSLQVSDMISYRTLDLCETTFQPVISSSIYKCVVLGCIHPSSVKGTKGSLTGQFGRFRVFGVPPGCSEERESEYWLSWPDIAEIILISTSQHTHLDEATLQANPLSRVVWHSQNQNVISAGDVERVEDEKDSLRVTGSGSFPHDDKQMALPVVRVENILADVGFVAGSVQKIKLKTKKRRNRITSITPTVGSITDCTAEEFAITVQNHNLCEARLEEDHCPDSRSSSSFLMMTSTVTVDSIGHIDTATSSSQELAYQDTHDYAGEEVLYKENEEMVVKDSAMGILIEQPQPLHQSDENGDKDGVIDGNGDKIATSSFFSFADLFDDILMQRRSQIGADEEVHF